MTTLPIGSAQIYQFPAGGRAGVNRSRQQATASEYTARLPKIAFGGGWYHDEAIQDADRARNN
jgi:hypothetical protein